MLVTLPGPQFQTCILSHTVRPNATEGVDVVNGGSSAYGSYAQIIAGASVTTDIYLIEIRIRRAANTATTNSTMLYTIGLDPAGGTSYTDTINHLMFRAPNSSGGVQINSYLFPLFIRSGTSIGVKCMNSEATGGNSRVSVHLWGDPKHPEMAWAGKGVETLGVTLGTPPTGVTATPGTTSVGNWATIGTTTNDCHWWQVAMKSGGDTADANLAYLCDLAVGNGTARRIVIHRANFETTTNEVQMNRLQHHGWGTAPAGSTVEGRIWNSGTNEPAYQMAAYGVWG
jgi:hypothetical protein